MRKAACDNLQVLGITIDDRLNEAGGEDRSISAAGSDTSVLVIQTNEELVIALDTLDIVRKLEEEKPELTGKT